MILPPQSPLFRSIHKDRYSRQEIIKEIEGLTGRKLIIYMTNMNHQMGFINRIDIAPFGDLLEKHRDGDLDLLIQSPGGDIDIAEKIIDMCRQSSKSFRVIVTECAKSAATLIALGADSILMGYTSELGPIDPQVTITTPSGKEMQRPAQSFLDGLEEIKNAVSKEGKLSPVYFPLLEHLDPALIDYCNKSIERSKAFAKKWLKNYMFKEDAGKADSVAEKLCDTKKYLSHGTVIDAKEAKEEIGLKVDFLEKDNELWNKLWRLHCDYLIDMRNSLKIFESSEVSIPLPA